MDKQGLVEIVDSELKSIGFKRKGLVWRAESGELIKEVDLQKSRFSNLYYINFGFIIKGLSLSLFKQHVPRRIYSHNLNDAKFINDFLDLEILDERDIDYFKKLFNDVITTTFIKVNTVNELKTYVISELKQVPILLPNELKNLFNID